MIRVATLADVPRLLEMGLTFAASSEYAAHFTADPDTVHALMVRLVTTETATVFVAERDGALVGMIGIGLYLHPFTGQPTTGEVFLWVEPTARGSLGIRLIKRAEAWARAAGATKNVMIAPNAAVARLYAALGYTQVETIHQKEL